MGVTRGSGGGSGRVSERRWRWGSYLDEIGVSIAAVRCGGDGEGGEGEFVERDIEKENGGVALEVMRRFVLGCSLITIEPELRLCQPKVA